MEKVIVIGSPGAGKSTFSRALHQKTGLPLYHLDLLWHKADRTTVSPEEFDATLGRVLPEERWIIDGNYARTLAPRLEACDTVFLLDYPLEVCLEGIRSRMGKPRADMPWVETEPDPEFIQWVTNFPREQMPLVERQLEEYRGRRRIIRFTRREEAAAFLAQLPARQDAD